MGEQKTKEEGMSKKEQFGGPVINDDEIQLGKKLGQGQFGDVYLGTCRAQKVAVKVPRARLSEAQVEEFRKEIEAMSKIVHPNVVPLLGAYFPPKGDTSGELKVVMEFYGSDLEKYIFDTKRALSLARRIGWARQVARGMCWIHGGGYVHLDLKPANLLLDLNTDIVKVGDFGLAVLVPKDKGFLEASAKGTPVYAAPELYLDDRVSPACDVYSFAVCCFEFVTRKMAYSGMTLPNTMEGFFRMVVGGKRPWNDEVPVPKSLPKTVVRLINACWKSEPSQRPTFQDVMRAMPTVMVDSAIPQPDLAKLWLSLCPPGEIRTTVPFDEFKNVMLKALNATENYAESLLRQLFVTKVEGEPVVDYEKLGRATQFMPTMTKLNNAWYQRIVNITKQEWFWGDVSSSEAQKKLVASDKKRFIIRYSSVAPHYTISIRTTNVHDPVAHRRILRNANSPEVVLERDMLKLKHGKYDSIEALVKLCEKQLKLRPLKNGPFEWVYLVNPYAGDQMSDPYAADIK